MFYLIRESQMKQKPPLLEMLETSLTREITALVICYVCLTRTSSGHVKQWQKDSNLISIAPQNLREEVGWMNRSEKCDFNTVPILSPTDSQHWFLLSMTTILL